MIGQTNNSGYGQQDPFVANDDFNVTSFMVKQMVRRMETNRLVQVKAIHAGDGTPPASGTVDVLPLVQQVDGNNNVKSHGTVYGIPVFRLQGAFGSIILDPKVGDIGYVAVCNRDSSIVKTAKKESPPGSGRTFDLADGIYVGGLLNSVTDQYLWFDDGKIKIADKNGNTIVMDSDGVTATDKFGHVLRMKSSGFELTGNLNVIGTIHATGAVSGDSTAAFTGAVTGAGHSLSTHVHGGVTTGGGSTGTPVG